jgi:NADH-quinone oxidoreductase subunit A
MSTEILTTQYLPIAVTFIIATALCAFIVWASGNLGPKRNTDKKLMPYESGMTPIGGANRRIPVRYYLIAVLFILFDIEVIFFLPWATALLQNGKSFAQFALAEMLVFTITLVVGYIYVWKRGALNWE